MPATDGKEKPLEKPAGTPAIMSSRYATSYDEKRDPFHGLEYDPYTKKVHDAR